MKRMMIICLMIISSIILVGCNKNNYKWNNDEAIYVTINNEYVNNVVLNIDQNFKYYKYKKVYVVNKEVNNETNYLKLLFIVDNGIDEFINKLRKDKRIQYYEKCKDLPYESIDNRYFEYPKDNIEVGDKLTIKLMGNSDIYMEKFLYDSFYVIPNDYDKNRNYNKNYFSKIDNILDVENKNGKLLIRLIHSDYYELISTMDIIARKKNVQFIDFDYIEVVSPIWELDNKDLVDVAFNDNNSITITALKPGVVNIKYDVITCNINIRSK